MKFIIFEGLDNCFKTTNIERLKNHYISNDIMTHVLHYSAIKVDNVIEKSKMLYKSMFGLMTNLKYECADSNNYIFDRAHLGEWVYGKIYRKYDANFIWELEEQYKFLLENLYLIVLVDSNIEELCYRDDGLSFSTDFYKKVYEKNRFDDAFDRSLIKKKIFIDVNGLSRDRLFTKILNFIENADE